ncbi:MAG TPA: hypothetical protein DDX85_06380 [Nitrospiraceae bacterium]|nr:hypothetical protein [Nitrospiraceae bacterium]
MEKTISKRDERIIKLSPLLKYIGLVISLIGVTGVIVGINKLYILNPTSSRTYDEVITGLSFGIVLYGLFIYG